MADRRRQRGLGGDPGQLRLQPALQFVEARRGLGPADCNTPVGRLPAGLRLDGVEGGDPFQRLGGDRQALGGMDIEELAAHMRQAGHLAERAGSGQRAEPGIAVRVQPTANVRNRAGWVRRSGRRQLADVACWGEA